MLAQNTHGYGLMVRQKLGRFWQYMFPRKETCLLLRDPCQVWPKSMECIYYINDVNLGTKRLVSS